mmetsp:Transcript_50011/g.89771  ORF Transcript_50011/g.89771 Transcript_50011/m.89771 type:complete len:207 (-) Transcript_50011:397-1017(-)
MSVASFLQAQTKFENGNGSGIVGICKPKDWSTASIPLSMLATSLSAENWSSSRTGTLVTNSCITKPTTPSIAARPCFTSALWSFSGLVPMAIKLGLRLSGSKDKSPGNLPGCGLYLSTPWSQPVASRLPCSFGTSSIQAEMSKTAGKNHVGKLLRPPFSSEGASSPFARPSASPHFWATDACSSSELSHPTAASIAKRPCFTSASR